MIEAKSHCALFLSWGLSLVPRNIQLLMGKLIGRIAFLAISKRAKICSTNIKLCLPDLDSQKTALKCFEHYGMYLIELFLLPHAKRRFSRWIRFSGEKHYKDFYNENQGVIMLTAHMGNWEMLGAVSRFGPTIYGIYQKLKHLDLFIHTLRSGIDTVLIEKKSALKSGIKALKSGHVLGHVGDQGKGVTVLFFNRPTEFPAGPARIAIKTKCPMLLSLCIRENKFLHIKISGELKIQNGDNEEEIIRATMQSYANWLEEQIRLNPEQYFWMHDIWKLHKKHSTHLPNPEEHCS
jgi:KDO2-lipid IV(A) lauroyltransferase